MRIISSRIDAIDYVQELAGTDCTVEEAETIVDILRDRFDFCYGDDWQGELNRLGDESFLALLDEVARG